MTAEAGYPRPAERDSRPSEQGISRGRTARGFRPAQPFLGPWVIPGRTGTGTAIDERHPGITVNRRYEHRTSLQMDIGQGLAETVRRDVHDDAAMLVVTTPVDQDRTAAPR